MSELRTIREATEAAMLIRAAVGEHPRLDRFREQALWRVADCLDVLATRDTLELELPPGEQSFYRAGRTEPIVREIQSSQSSPALVRVEAA